MVNVRVDVDISDVDAELERLENLPPAVVLRLEGVLATAYALTQQTVHVITGSLKGSGQFGSRIVRNVWRGHIEYGGMTPGPNNPVDYAAAEAGRGGDHDFMAPARALDARYGAIIADYLRGRQ